MGTNETLDHPAVLPGWQEAGAGHGNFGEQIWFRGDVRIIAFARDDVFVKY